MHLYLLWLSKTDCIAAERPEVGPAADVGPGVGPGVGPNGAGVGGGVGDGVGAAAPQALQATGQAASNSGLKENPAHE